MINLGSYIKWKKISENKTPRKITNIVEKRLDFNKQQKDKGLPSDWATQLKKLTLTQMLERLPITLAQIKEGNTSENLPNEIRQIIYSLYQAK